MTREVAFATEADLCAAFIAWVKDEAGKFRAGKQVPRWTPYAETAGWDILLVGEDGTQIGVQAKLKFNLKLFAQTVPPCWEAWRDDGPDYRAVLVGADAGYGDLCAALGLTLFRPSRGDDFTPGLGMEHWDGGWHYWSPRKRSPLPDFVPDVIAGASGPVQLTKWKVQALRLVARLELRGYVTRQDFRTLGIDPRRWFGPSGWLVASPDRPGEFTRAEAIDFDRQHPTVYAQVLEETRGLDLHDPHRMAGPLFAEGA